MNAPLIVVTLMVKNEAHAIETTLLPYVKGGVLDICVLDTGSTDSTVETTKAFFEKHNVNGFIDEEPFVDFATSRNAALARAEKHFPTATFFIMTDADWTIHNIPLLIKFCEERKADTDALYYLKIGMGGMSYSMARLFRVSAKIRYEGVVHEVPDHIPNVCVYEDVYFEPLNTRDSMRKSKARYQRDADLLLVNFEKNPTDSRSTFYLAQTYECMGELKNAYKYYLLRSKLPGWSEENVVTFFRLGCIAENLSMVEKDVTWGMALDFYLTAFAMRPTRIEPLVKIAQYYLKEKPQISFVYMKHAIVVPYPKTDQLFIQKYMYDYTRYQIMSQCAWVMGENLLGKEATEMALRLDPNNQTLIGMLGMYQNKLNQGNQVAAQVSAAPTIVTVNSESAASTLSV